MEEIPDKIAQLRGYLGYIYGAIWRFYIDPEAKILDTGRSITK